MSALTAVMTREAKIRATNLLFIFWDVLYPLGYLLVFGVGINASLGFSSAVAGVDYNAFFLAGVLAMASFGIASNTSWSFFLDRDNGIFYEMLTYPMSRSEYLVGSENAVAHISGSLPKNTGLDQFLNVLTSSLERNIQFGC